MGKIKILFIQEKKIRNKAKVLTVGDIIEKQVPDTYEINYISIKEDVVGKIEQFQPEIVYIGQSKTFDILEFVKRIKRLFPAMVILVNLSDSVNDQQELIIKLKEAGVYKCYYSTLIIETLIHDMFVALNME